MIVTAGAASAVDQGLHCLRRGGTLVCVGMPADGRPAQFDAGALAHDGKRILGSKLGSARPAVDIPRIAALYLEGRLRLDELVTAVYPLERINAAIDVHAPRRGHPERDRAVSDDGDRIASVESFTDEWVGFVRVRTGDGAEGWGQVSPYNADITAAVLHRQVAPHVLGADPADAAALGDRVLEAEHKYPGSYVCRALAGVDTALWDLRARRAGVPVCTLAGGAPRELDAYASSMRRDIAPADEAQRLARLRAEHGFGAFKFRVGSECGHDRDEWPGRTEEIVPAIRRALGDDARLLVDANSCYTPARAIEVGRFLEQWGVEHFEEPCPYWQLEWTAEVAAALDLNVAGGEQDCFLWQWRRMVALRAVDVVQPDVCYVGGFTRALAVAAHGRRGRPAVRRPTRPTCRS